MSCAAGRVSTGLQRSSSALPRAFAGLCALPEPHDLACGRLISSLTLPALSLSSPMLSKDPQQEDAASPPSSQTMYRRWTWPVAPDRSDPEPVPGLRDVLSGMGLAGCIAKAEAWCEENGAAFLEECAQECEDLSLALGPPAASRCAELQNALLTRAYSDEGH